MERRGGISTTQGNPTKKICTGPKVSIYAEDLEDMVSQCIGVKLAEFNRAGLHKRKEDHGALNDLKLKVKAIEQSEKQLLDTMLTGGFNQDLLAIVNQKATQLKQDRIALQSRMKELLDLERETDDAIDLVKSWKRADYTEKKAVAMIMLHQIRVREDGSMQVIWNL